MTRPFLTALAVAAATMLMPPAGAMADPAAKPERQVETTASTRGIIYRPVSAFAKAERERARRARSFRSARGCPANKPILYRGNLYCFRGR